MRNTCQRVRGRLPSLADGTLPRWRRRPLLHHVGRCDACAGELARQQTVADGLRELSDAAPRPEPEAPRELLDTILQQVHDPDLRARVAGPARGAVSGARPELSVTALLVAVLVSYLAWRGARRLLDRFHEPE